MTATERLRAMLDERVVEWTKPSGLNERYANELTFIGDHAVISSIDGSDLLRINFDGTPEQAIAATLGAGTCKMEYGADMLPECGNCHEPLVYYTKRHGLDAKDKRSANFCPNCGKRVSE